jgi:peptidoglycan/xylan/chitin deacetylase (PgdA/CDA1 family)
VVSNLPPLALAYHGIDDIPLSEDPLRLFVRPPDFVRQVKRLRSWGYSFVHFSELARRLAEGRAAASAALTFDDGFANNLETLAPVLAQLDVTATVFVVSGWLGGQHPEAPRFRILTEDQLRSLHATGVEIGAHTVTHPDLTTLSKDQATDELRTSKSQLEEMLAASVSVAAYPYGRANAETLAACADAGIFAACRTAGNGSWAELHNLPRQDMDNRCSLLGLRLKRDDRYESLMRFKPVRGVRRIVRHVPHGR